MALRVLVLGSSGMAGHVMTLRLAKISGISVIDVGPRHKVFDSTRTRQIEDPGALEDLIEETKPNFIVNCIGVLVKRSESHRLEAIWNNAYLPNLLSSLCRDSSRKLIHISTDCVFSGKNGPYSENDFRDGSHYYDRTKALGELENGKDLTIRTSITGPELKSDGVGLFSWFMRQNGEINGYRKALWSGVMTTQLAEFVASVITTRPDLCGLIHYATRNGISKYELLKIFQDTFNRKEVKINPMDEPTIDKRLVNTRKDFGEDPPEYPVQVKQMKRWMGMYPELYVHYGLAREG